MVTSIEVIKRDSWCPTIQTQIGNLKSHMVDRKQSSGDIDQSSGKNFQWLLQLYNGTVDSDFFTAGSSAYVVLTAREVIDKVKTGLKGLCVVVCHTPIASTGG